MSKKTVEIQAVGAIDYNKQKIRPGQTFACPKDEADRLIGLGAACIPVPQSARETDQPAGLTVAILRAQYPGLVANIEAAAREGYVRLDEAKRDFDALQKELEAAQEALRAAAKK